MAAYGTLAPGRARWGHTEVAHLLQQTLDEEGEADKELSAIAEGGINRTAADIAHPAGDEALSSTVTVRTKPATKAAGRR
jgi:hypothetical protein